MEYYSEEKSITARRLSMNSATVDRRDDTFICRVDSLKGSLIHIN